MPAPLIKPDCGEGATKVCRGRNEVGPRRWAESELSETYLVVASGGEQRIDDHVAFVVVPVLKEDDLLRT